MSSPARKLAAEVLLRVDEGGAFANLALDSALRSAGVLEPREAALTTELVYGTLRWQLQLDRAIAAHSDRPPEELDKPVRVALRLATFELLHHLRVPERAAVNEGVELVKDLHAARATGFVNAVLRRIAKTRKAPALPLREVDEAGHIAALTAHPRWLVELWIKWLGAQQTELLCAANQEQAQAVVRVVGGKFAEAQAALLRSGIESIPGRYSPDALVLAQGAPPALDLEGHAEGFFQAQDEAAQLVSRYAAPGLGARVLDACAAPGGKACHLAELVGPEGRVVAIDLHTRKAQVIAEAAQRLGLKNLEARAADASLPLPGETKGFDLVLVDAPCSGLGTLRRHPEVKLRRTPADLDRLAGLQRKLLEQCALSVKPGGLLVYALCTLTPEECDEQIERFLSSHPGFKPEPPPAGWALPAADVCIDARGRLMTFPHRDGTDGFFAARLRKEN